MSTRLLWMTAILSSGGAFVLYVVTAAPGLTWAHFGADGAELLTAAIQNGVPHPPGYPLYILLLQVWLQAEPMLNIEPARLGNLFSGMWAALSVGITVLTASQLVMSKRGWMIGAIAGLLWAVSPLLWSQAVITEVYTLHIFLVTILGWLIFTRSGHPYWLVLPFALGVANHATFILLLPATLYYLWTRTPTWQRLLQGGALLIVALFVGSLFYLRIPLVASTAHGPPPVNWGYADNWGGFRWLVSGAAYHEYQFGLPAVSTPQRIVAWARVLTEQYTPVGLILALLGFAYWDRHQPQLRNLSILWIVPISLYTIFYNTWDSAIYLLPVTWLCAIWLAVGLETLITWLQNYLDKPWATAVPITICAVALVATSILAFTRLPVLSLRHDTEVQVYLHAVEQTVEPDSIIVTGADAETFALWYAAWGSGELLDAAPDTVLLAYPLYQFDWYRRLLAEFYPHVAGSDMPLDVLLANNAPARPIYFTDPPEGWSKANFEPAGPLWRYSK